MKRYTMLEERIVKRKYAYVLSCEGAKMVGVKYDDALTVDEQK